MGKRPGMMIWLDRWRPLMALDDATVAELLRTAIRYVDEGRDEPPEGLCQIFWQMLKPDLDRDAAAYENTRQHRRYAVYCREEKRAGQSPLEYEAWASRDISGDPTASAASSTAPDPDPYPDSDPDTDPEQNQSISLSNQSEKEGDRGEKTRREGRFSKFSTEFCTNPRRNSPVDDPEDETPVEKILRSRARLERATVRP